MNQQAEPTPWVQTPFGSAMAGAVAGALLSTLITWFAGKDGLSLTKGAVLAMAALFVSLAAYYYAVFQFAEPGHTAAERKPYRELRKQIAAGGRAAQMYDTGVAWLLRAISRAFGDGDRDDVFWSAASFDRCVMLAITYPLLLMTVLWVFDGGIVGQAEEAVGFAKERPDWRRGLALVGSAIMVAAALFERNWQSRRAELSWKQWFVILAVLIFGMQVGMRSGAGVGVAAIALTLIVPTTAGIKASGVVTLSLSFLLFLGSYYQRDGISALTPETFGVILGFCLAFYTVIATADFAQKRGWFRWFWSLFFVMSLAALLFAVPTLLDLNSFGASRAVSVVFLVSILALINAPFDWASLGLTRYLLRKNLVLNGWWAIALGMIDLLAALLSLMLLALAMVWAAQAFNASVIAQGGQTVFDPVPVITALADPQTRWDPQFWWIHGTLFATFIPSLANLAIGALAVLRAFDPMKNWILASLPDSGKIHPISRVVVAGALASHLPLALMAGSALLWFFGWLVINLALPAFAATALPGLGDIAALDLAGQLVRWLLG